jgi:hypothetical protein
LGYRSVRLDTGPKQAHAERLYRRAGFAPIAAYNDCDDVLVLLQSA